MRQSHFTRFRFQAIRLAAYRQMALRKNFSRKGKNQREEAVNSDAISTLRSESLARISAVSRRGLEPHLVRTTILAIEAITHSRFWKTERGFHGEFHSVLRQMLLDDGIIAKSGPILEQEYQKSLRHEMRQRPDSVLHIPAEESGLEFFEGNFGVWALKRKATETDASDDFEKLYRMFDVLQYPVGFFINIGSRRTFREQYTFPLSERLHCIGCDWGVQGARMIYNDGFGDKRLQ
jgi:hypothetical protein